MIRRSRPAAHGWAAAYALAAVVHLGALLTGAEALADASQWVLMPLLAAALVTATRWPRGHLVRWGLAALAASWLGDSLPSLLRGDAAFLAMIGCFLLAQVAYVVAFAPDARRSVLHRRPALLVPYGFVLVGLVAACAPHAGSLLVPVAIYGGVLTAMAVLATGVGPLVAVGGAVFLVSDGLIALGRFVPAWDPSGQDFWVMLTYVAAQALIVVGIAARNRAVRRAPAAEARQALPA
ncbi:lysoplasmalogenase [Cellulomonas sp. PhB150]|uniref:lysoplasmalogenase n=1 Tax=Cellulomonas sp. PhB150 TaxID=2485188 RepID=UPI000F96B5DE|nr:lysoplasmalogenase [Cellulomonas sp. PhB150]ROS30878.1 putative membrane protein YhhN [Cellulomonas sp. PhB150]